MTLVVAFSVEFNVDVNQVRFEFLDEENIPELGLAPDEQGSTKFHGYCDEPAGVIYLNKNHWNKISYAQQRELVFHELGHCVLDMGHEHNEDIMMGNRKYATKADGSNWKSLLNKMKERLKKRTAK